MAESSSEKVYYLPDDPNGTPLTHEEYCALMRPIWRQRKQLQRAGECKAPGSYVCGGDCCGCAYRCCGNTVGFDTLERIGVQLADPFELEEDVLERIFKAEIECCLQKMDAIDQIIIRCTILQDTCPSERQMASMITEAIGREYSHQAVHKRIPLAAKRLAALLGYPV